VRGEQEIDATAADAPSNWLARVMYPDWAWTERFPGLIMDKSSRWTVCGPFTPIAKPACGLFRSIHGRGHELYADTYSLWTEQGCGLFVDMDGPSSWTEPGS
jgi:hypothetical protein